MGYAVQCNCLKALDLGLGGRAMGVGMGVEGGFLFSFANVQFRRAPVVVIEMISLHPRP